MLSELYFKNVRVKNAPGHFTKDGYHYEKKLMVRGRVAKPKKIKIPKWVKELVPKTKTGVQKDKRRISTRDWTLMELRQKRKQLNKEIKEVNEEAGIKLKREILKAEFDAFYKRYPRMKPEPNVKVSATKPVDCSNPRYEACNLTVYSYKNGNRKSVILEKLPPQPKKPKPVKPPKKLKWRQLQRRIRNAAYDAKVANAANGVADGCSCNL